MNEDQKLERWFRGIFDSLGKAGGTIKGHFVVTDDSALKALQAMAQPSFFQEIMEDFLANDILGPHGALTKEFEPAKRNPQAYAPKMFHYGNKGDGDFRKKDALDFALQTPDGATIDDLLSTDRKLVEFNRTGKLGPGAMFTDLWRVLSRKPEVRVVGTQVIGGVGRLSDLMALPLGPYMPIQGDINTNPDRGLNRLFLAVEYGTGIAENVGGSPWVRLTGPTKDKTTPGAWWLGQKAGQGVMFKGQMGVHFLHDARSRMPKGIYLWRFQESLPQLVRERLASMRAGGEFYAR